jgi:hypothetical protein
MKNIFVIALTLFVVLGIHAFAQPLPAPGSSSPASQAQEGALKKIRGTVKADGDKLTFVTDEDGKSWEVMNPEMLKGHEGHHVELNVHLYADKGVIHVHTVKMLENSKKQLGGQAIPPYPFANH